MPIYRQFITDDEINAALSGGVVSPVANNALLNTGRGNHSTKEKADFLKNEYGIGGRSHALSGATGDSEDHDAKGLKYNQHRRDDVKAIHHGHR